MRGEPIHVENAGLDRESKTGRFQLTADSPGVAAGVAIPKFSDGYVGDAHDMGDAPARRASDQAWCGRQPVR